MKKIDLQNQNLNFIRDNITYKIVYLETKKMIIGLMSENADITTIPFAQLTKKLKKQIKDV